MSDDAVPARDPLRVGVLASGQGTNLQALLDRLPPDQARVVAVAGDRADAIAFRRAADVGVEHAAFPRDEHPSREARDAAIAAWLAAREVELVVLAGYMAILTPAFLRAFPDRVLNVHPSLLPAFPGIRAIEQAVAYGVRVFGVTVHLVDEGVDTGPIVLQEAIQLHGPIDAATVHAALQPIEHRLLPEAVGLVARGALRRDPDDPRRVLVG
ncbi:Phosphoribosylglycineamide formyltransferase [Patulibacter medicamentivorans]|uniref:Phosphoribosylglycinamide formyltransferase n=1 Tax=Patulibacter medicamentivorans TaxID=1097667 RepID=H0EB32_9ACTN|nr:phosphoribosylglycinamide formyltransferase [Patulibacter medicamentivorans]EHN09107.1 Phosphoribosylglycineamide formyltransferase [Patulibacter medicamentivorans]